MESRNLLSAFYAHVDYGFPIFYSMLKISHCENVICPFTGGALPALAQLAVSTYHTASASSHSAISQITIRVEERGTNPLMQAQLRESSHQSPVNQKS